MKAPSSSSIIVYGHENGIRVIWRGGNGAKKCQREVEPLYASVNSTLDVALGGSEALHIAFPHLPTDVHHNTKSLPDLFSEKLVVAVACSDCSIRVVTLPLTPPKSEGKQAISNARVEQVLTLTGSAGHQSLPNCVSLTYTSPRSFEDEDVDMEDRDETTRQLEYPSKTSQPVSRRSSHSNAQDERSWDLLVASHSRDLSGRLLIHRIPISGAALDDSAEAAVPLSTHRLASPAVSVCFSSALHPSPYHSRLLIAEARGVVRIMDVMPKPGSFKGPSLASFYTEFKSSSDGALPRRKPIMDARWLLGGRAVIVLLSNSEWGVWDFENAGPRPAEAVLEARKATNPSQFAFDGRVETKTSNLTGCLNNSKATNETKTKLAPMTPSTRKTRQTMLFAGPEQEQQGPARGGISIIPASSNSSGRADDESVLLWHGTNIVTVPSFFTHWQNRVRGSGNLFGSGAKGEIRSISNVRFSGESCNEVSLNPTGSLEIVVTAEHRLILIALPHTEKRGAAPATKAQDLSVSTDETLFVAGELDILGMDRVLDGMSNGHRILDVTSTKTNAPKFSQYGKSHPDNSLHLQS